jgi:hypothetical protein
VIPLAGGAAGRCRSSSQRKGYNDEALRRAEEK